MRFALLAVFWLAIGFSTHGNCAAVDRSFTLNFYSAISELEDISLQSLKNAGLISEIEPLLFVFNGVAGENTHELESARRVANQLSQRVLLISDLPGLRGVPAVDAIVFSDDGKPVANIGIKTYLGATTRGIDSAKGYLIQSRASVRDLLTTDYIAGLFQFEISPETGLPVAKKGTPDQKLRSLLVEGVFRLLGLSRVSSRPVWIAVDFSGDPLKHLNLVKGFTGENPIPTKGTFIDFVDDRRDENAKRKVINIESLVARSGQDAIVKRYLFLLNRESITVDESGFKVANSEPQTAVARIVEEAKVRFRLWCSRVHLKE